MDRVRPCNSREMQGLTLGPPVVDKTGQLVYMGGIDSISSSNAADIAGAKNYVRVALDAMAAGKAIEDSVTRPYGCSVKY